MHSIQPDNSTQDTHELSPSIARGTAGPATGFTAARVLARGRAPSIESYDIRNDRRIPILDADESPWKMICSLEIRAGRIHTIGTGWLAGPRTVVTAGHCLYHLRQLGGWADEIKVVPGRNYTFNDTDTAEPFGNKVVHKSDNSFSVTDEWFDHHNPDADYGAIHLDEAFANLPNYFSFGTLPDSRLWDARVNISGYPSDKGGGTQWFHSDKVSHVSDRRLFYATDTYGGQSGSPIWIYPEENEGLLPGVDPQEPVVVGIHAYGYGGTPLDLGIRANSGPRITAEVLQIIKEWASRV